MDILTNVNQKLDDFPLNQILFKILLKYDHNQDDHDCYECLMKVCDHLNENKKFYILNPYKITVNELENDLITYDDLMNEFKDHVYPLFKVNVLSLLINFKYHELFYIEDYLANHDLTNYIELLNTSLNDFNVQAGLDKLVTPINFEEKIVQAKNIVRNTNDEEIKHKYLEVMAAYFNYQVMVSHNVQ